MRLLARLLSCLSALSGALMLIRLRFGLVGMVIWRPKLFAEALALPAAIAGGLGALLGLVRRDGGAMLTGLLGAAVAVQHIARLSASNQEFEQAFGPDWESGLAPALRDRLSPRRWTWRTPNPPPALWQRDVAFATHPESGDPLLADIWQPPQGVPATGLAIIYLHGSGWHYADKDFRTRRLFRRLAGQGHVIMDVAYTLAPKARLREMVFDVKRAIAWMKENAARYSVNPERIVLMGGSAGGHLALLAAYAPQHPAFQPPDLQADASVRAVVSFYGPVDLRAQQDYFEAHFTPFPRGDSWLGRLFVFRWEAIARRIGFLPSFGNYVAPIDLTPGLVGSAPDEAPELYELGSPLQHVGPGCPPTLLVQGAHDLGGMDADVRRLHQALRRTGTPVVYVDLPSTEHAFDLIVPLWSPALQAALHDTERFLALMV